MADQGTPTKRRGRPPKPEAERTRGNLTFRVRPQTRERLEAAASISKTSISEEIEARLEHTFWEDDYGKTLAGVWTNVLVSMAGSDETARLVRDICSLIDKIERDMDHKWPSSDFARMVVRTALTDVIAARLAPSGEYPEAETAYADQQGHIYAEWMLDKLSKPRN